MDDLEIATLTLVKKRETNIIEYCLYVESKKMIQMTYLEDRN